MRACVCGCVCVCVCVCVRVCVCECVFVPKGIINILQGIQCFNVLLCIPVICTALCSLVISAYPCDLHDVICIPAMAVA